MARKAPTLQALRALFARSGNRCAFPGCDHPLVNENGTFVAEVCHITAAESGGPRFDPTLNDEERRALSNLIVLCHRHHVETDDVTVYPVVKLEQMKYQHEASGGLIHYRIDESVLHRIADEMDEYWRQLEKAKGEHVVPDLAIPVPQDSTYSELLDEASATIANLYTLADWCDGPFEVKELGIPNSASRLNALVLLMAAKFFESRLALTPNDGLARNRLESIKKELLEIAKHGGLAD